MAFVNKYDRETLRKKLEEESFKRTTLSFYRYVHLENPPQFRNQLFKEWSELKVLGRIYIAEEGINAQISIPEFVLDAFRQNLDSRNEFKDMPFKIAVEDDGKSFIKLIIKVKHKIVADGLDDNTLDYSNIGNHLSAEEFNRELEKPGTIVVDVRNHYESEVGHFENAILPQADTFREELPLIIDLLKEKKDNKILLYCTGGIRCEKASIYLKQNGFKDVNQLHGGIISYAKEIKEKGLPSKFKGKNFVFDERLGEKITDDVIGRCHQCGNPSDHHRNCANDACHLLFIQCMECEAKMEGCCSEECKEMIHLPEEKKKEIRRQNALKFTHHKKIRPSFQLTKPVDIKE